ncbi:MAG: hypothetical protein JRE82_04165 [Deltaproteobacteria bacterium]|nr:hypothetical protein [Deltaproteobacteria bacterium]
MAENQQVHWHREQVEVGDFEQLATWHGLKRRELLATWREEHRGPSHDLGLFDRGRVPSVVFAGAGQVESDHVVRQPERERQPYEREHEKHGVHGARAQG